jgi:hypothetical protein
MKEKQQYRRRALPAGPRAGERIVFLAFLARRTHTHSRESRAPGARPGRGMHKAATTHSQPAAAASTWRPPRAAP